MHNFPASSQLSAGPSVRAYSAKVLKRLAFGLLIGFTLTAVPLRAQDDNSQDASKGQSAASPTPASALDFSDEVVRDVLTNFQRGLETHSLDRTLSVFDPDSMTDYPHIRDQMIAFFRLNDSIKFRYQLLQVSSDHDIGTAIADVEMDPLPADILPTERRRTAQMRFQLKRTPGGWRIIALKPMDFFE